MCFVDLRPKYPLNIQLKVPGEFHLNKVRTENAEIILMTPGWPNQWWFPNMLDFLIDFLVALQRITWNIAHRKRTMLNAAHILLQNPRTDVRGESIFICFQNTCTCNCFQSYIP